MKIITINLNGIRGAARKGVFTWLKKQNADVICLQEVRAQEKDIQDKAFFLEGYHAHFHFAQKKGYSGVGIYSRLQPKHIHKGLGWDVADQEGRNITIDLGNLCISSLYMPSGTSGDERQAIKFDFLKRYANHLERIREDGRDHIICGDWNIAHKNIDLKNWRANQKNSGFLPEERAWLDWLFEQAGFVDAFRLVNQEADQYTWWSHRGRAWDNNVGWRIDYQVITEGLAALVKAASIYKDERFSDHAPLIMEYEIAL